MDRLPVGWDEGPGLVASVWRYRWLVAVVGLAGALAGVGFSRVQPVLYEGSSRVLLVDPSSERVFQDAGGQQVDPERYVRNQAAFMMSPPVLDRAVRLVGGRVTVKQLRKRLATEPSKDEDLVTVRVRDGTAAGAAELADAVARAYEETAVRQARQAVARTVAQLRATESSLRGRLEDLEARLRAGDATARVERDAVAAQLARVDQRAQELGVEGAVGDPVRLAERAELPEAPVQPQPLRLAAVGGLLGLVVAAGLAWGLAWRRQAPAARPQRPAWPHTAAPLLGEIPDFAGLIEEGQVPTATDPGSTAGRAYRALAGALQSVVDRAGVRSLVVTSPELGDGKTLTSVNLAVAIGESGRHVVLVDADQRRRGLSQLCDLDGQPGLSDLADGVAPIDHCLWLPAFTGIQVIPAGAPVDDSARFLQGPTFSRAIFQVRQHASLTVVDGPALLAAPDAQTIAEQVDGVVLVVRPETSAVALIEARRRLDAIGSPLLGYVLNRTGSRALGYADAGDGDPAAAPRQLTWRALELARRAETDKAGEAAGPAEQAPRPNGAAAEEAEDVHGSGRDTGEAGEPGESGEAARRAHGADPAAEAERTDEARRTGEAARPPAPRAAWRPAEREAEEGAGRASGSNGASDDGTRTREANGTAREAASEGHEGDRVATEATGEADDEEPAERRTVKASSTLGEPPAAQGRPSGGQT